MALDTYTALQTSIAGWLNRADLTSAIPDFITLAEAQINRRLLEDGPVRQMMGRSDATISDEYAAVPTDFMGAKAFLMTSSTPPLSLDFALPEQITKMKQGQTVLTGIPRVFSVVGPEFQFFPAPQDSYLAELTYWKRIPALSSTNATNWVLQYYPDAYLYGALLQSAPYLKDDDRVPVWAAAFQTILSDIIAADKVERSAPYLTVPCVPGGTP